MRIGRFMKSGSITSDGSTYMPSALVSRGGMSLSGGSMSAGMRRVNWPLPRSRQYETAPEGSITVVVVVIVAFLARQAGGELLLFSCSAKGCCEVVVEEKHGDGSW